MAFPNIVTNGSLHTEGTVDFYGANNKWRRRIYPQNDMRGQAGSASVAHNSVQFDIRFDSWDVPRNMVVIHGTIQPVQDTEVHCQFYNTVTNAWIPKASFRDPSGIVNWGEGGLESRSWNKGNFGAINWFPSIRDSTRVLKGGNPQLIRITLLKVDTNVTVVGWQFYSECVTNAVMIANYAKMDIPVAIENINVFRIGVESGTLYEGRLIANIY